MTRTVLILAMVFMAFGCFKEYNEADIPDGVTLQCSVDGKHYSTLLPNSLLHRYQFQNPNVFNNKSDAIKDAILWIEYINKTYPAPESSKYLWFKCADPEVPAIAGKIKGETK